jgi:hypothetical protein
LLFFFLCFYPPGSKLPTGENITHIEPVFG